MVVNMACRGASLASRSLLNSRPTTTNAKIDNLDASALFQRCLYSIIRQDIESDARSSASRALSTKRATYSSDTSNHSTRGKVLYHQSSPTCGHICKCLCHNSPIMMTSARNGMLHPPLARHFHSTSVRKRKQSKQESYFSAIGGETEEPPPDLTPAQVTQILRTNEAIIQTSIPAVRSIECNQLAANHPIEDRMKISRLNFNALLNPTSSDQKNTQVFGEPGSGYLPPGLLLSVIDGHGGGATADVVFRRLFRYVAVAVTICEWRRKRLYEGYDANLQISSEIFDSLVQDLYQAPNPDVASSLSLYDDRGYQVVTNFLKNQSNIKLKKFAQDLIADGDKEFPAIENEDLLSPQVYVPRAIKLAFQRCDDDLSHEIEEVLTGVTVTSRYLKHFYLSSAASGCCAIMALIINKDLGFVASTGDCRAVLGIHESGKQPKTVEMNQEHNSDNIDELKRLLGAHPKSEMNNVIKHNRLLGQLMPLRAFGDFNYKWPIEKMKRVGLLSAFGSHVVPPNYLTPPYLIVEPDVKEMPINLDGYLSETEEGKPPYVKSKFLILATDGLWEQFEASRNVTKCVAKHQQEESVNAQSDTESGSYLFAMANFPPQRGTTLGRIRDALASKNNPEPASFEEAIEEEMNKELIASSETVLDPNAATHLIRTALGTSPVPMDPHVDALELARMQHARLVSFLTLPESVVRNFRDDISLIIAHLSK